MLPSCWRTCPLNSKIQARCTARCPRDRSKHKAAKAKDAQLILSKHRQLHNALLTMEYISSSSRTSFPNPQTVGTSSSAFLTVATDTQSKHKGTAQTNMCKLKHKNVTATRLRIDHTTLATNHIYKCTETFQNTFKCNCMQQAHTASRKHVSTQS